MKIGSKSKRSEARGEGAKIKSLETKKRYGAIPQTTTNRKKRNKKRNIQSKDL